MIPAPRDAAPTPAVNPHASPTTAWLRSTLERNRETSYLRQCGSPRTEEEFRERVPVVSYDELAPWLDRVTAGESDVLFAGRPVAYERTSGSSSAAKLIPYSAEGLADFQRSIAPWFSDVMRTHEIRGRIYVAISPATRFRETIGNVPVGLSDGAYLGDAAALALARSTAVPFDVAQIADVGLWREETLRHLAAANDLELISVWSPTFLLRLLDDLGDARQLWPRLKVVSCWADGASKPFAAELASRLPHAHLQPKGLLSTETVVTVPDADDKPALTTHGFFEFEQRGRFLLEHELRTGDVYEVVATTASGLYRYRTADLVRCDGISKSARPILSFIGRGNLVSDLVGEKLSEPFVADCLRHVPGFRLLAPETEANGYVLLAEAGPGIDLDDVELRLCENPQYAYARRIGQLEPLRLVAVTRLFDRFAEAQLARGARLGDIKPAALRSERDWLVRLGCES